MKQNRISRILFLVLIFGVGFIAALYYARFISIPFSNPWNITGLLAVMQYNPLNNIAKFLFLLLLPSMLLLLISLHRKMRGILFTDNHDDHRS